MIKPSPASWTVRGATFALWLLAAGSAAYWALQLGGGPATATAPAATRQAAAVDPGAIARLLGGTPAAPGAAPLAAAAPDLAARFALVGVVAAASGGGAAVISVDGKPARPYRVGSIVDEGIVVQAVQGRRALLGQDRSGPPLLALELPALPAPAQGTPPAAGQRLAPKPAPR